MTFEDELKQAQSCWIEQKEKQEQIQCAIVAKDYPILFMLVFPEHSIESYWRNKQHLDMLLDEFYFKKPQAFSTSEEKMYKLEEQFQPQCDDWEIASPLEVFHCFNEMAEENISFQGESQHKKKWDLDWNNEIIVRGFLDEYDNKDCIYTMKSDKTRKLFDCDEKTTSVVFSQYKDLIITGILNAYEECFDSLVCSSGG